MCNKHNVLMMYTLYADQIMVIISHIKQLSFFFFAGKMLRIHSFTQSTANCRYYQTVQ